MTLNSLSFGEGVWRVRVLLSQIHLSSCFSHNALQWRMVRLGIHSIPLHRSRDKQQGKDKDKDKIAHLAHLFGPIFGLVCVTSLIEPYVHSSSRKNFPYSKIFPPLLSPSSFSSKHFPFPPSSFFFSSAGQIYSSPFNLTGMKKNIGGRGPVRRP